MTTTTDRAIAALVAGHDRLADRARAMSPADLVRRSAAADWTVADVLSHLGSSAEIMDAALDAALAGAPAPGDSFRDAVWKVWNAMPPPEQAGAFVTADRQLVDRFVGLDPAQRAELRIDLGFLPEPVDVLTAAELRLNEVVLHEWDIAVVDDPEATLAPEAVEFLFGPLRMLVSWIARPEPLAGRRTVLAVRLTGTERSFGLELDDPVRLVDLAGAPGSLDQTPPGSLDAPAEAFLRLTAGRLAPEQTPAAVRLVSDGVTLDDLRKVFPGY